MVDDVKRQFVALVTLHLVAVRLSIGQSVGQLVGQSDTRPNTICFMDFVLLGSFQSSTSFRLFGPLPTPP